MKLSSPVYEGGVFILLLECSHIKKSFGDRLIISIGNLKIYAEDRIGIVGPNGVGKTTLINILQQKLEPDVGWIKHYGNFASVSQLEPPENKNINPETASKFGVPRTWNERMSGGEKTRFKLAEAFSHNSSMILADEPTSNLDMEGIELMERWFLEYQGGLVLISHDRSFLDKLCNKILEIEAGTLKLYRGNYSDYIAQKAIERNRAQLDYDYYIQEKKRLQNVIVDRKQQGKSIKKTPKRMGNSEARLHKMGDQRAKASLDRAVKSAESRIEHLEVKEKPVEQEIMKFDVADSKKIHSKFVIEGRNVNKSFGDRILFSKAEFQIRNGCKVALVGPNGCGKSTLVKMIMEQNDSIKMAPGAKIGYFSQDMSVLNENRNILENVMEGSVYPESFVRTLLARLLFKKEDVYKKVSLLSGGERVKVSFAKILLKDINILILDEPTNYMDINSLEVMEEALRDYRKTILFVSHDRRFIHAVADHVMTIEGHKINMFPGNFEEYLAKKEQTTDRGLEYIHKQMTIIQHRISDIIGRLSMPSKKDDLPALDLEYQELVRELNRLKSKND